MDKKYIEALSSWNIDPDSYKQNYKQIMNIYLKNKGVRK